MEGTTAFSVFAQALAVYLMGANNNPSEFVRQLFKHIYKKSINQTDSYIDDAEVRTLKGYFYGQRNITEVAKRISKDLDLGAFAEFIHLDAEDSIIKLCDDFRNTCPTITESTYEMTLAERFQTIITEAAKAKRKRKSATKSDKSSTLEPSPQDKYGFYLVSEANSICPNDGCTHTLFTNENGHLGFLYQVVAIDPERPEDDVNNLIALCPSCAAKYKAFMSLDKIERMKEIKRRLQTETADQELLSEQRIQEGVRRVVQKIPQMRPDAPVDLNYDPVILRRKIKPENTLLYLKTKGHVNYYFKVVHDTFQQMGVEGKLRFQPFCEQVRMNYLTLREEGRDQTYIYRKLTDWLCQGTNEERDYCEIVISYFIQKCEVFDAIAE